MSSITRLKIVEELGLASENYRESYYKGEQFNDVEIQSVELLHFLKIVINVIDETLYKNRRVDNLFHSYNTIEINKNKLEISHLYEMLEGHCLQVY